MKKAPLAFVEFFFLRGFFVSCVWVCSFCLGILFFVQDFFFWFCFCFGFCLFGVLFFGFVFDLEVFFFCLGDWFSFALFLGLG